MKSFILPLAFLFVAVGSFAQNKPGSGIRPLTIGDTVPDLVFNNVLNYHSTTARLSDFKGKLVILDFWATWCSACLYVFPKLDSLQRENENILEIVLVNSVNTGDKETKVVDLFKRLKTSNGENYILPTIINDTLLNSLFEHVMIPHYVWIHNGKVKAITESEQVTKENILALYNGQPGVFKIKKDVLDYDSNKPFFLNGNGGNGENVLYRSMITGYADGIVPGTKRDINKEGYITRLCVINASILQLYQLAFQQYVFKNRILFEVKDRTTIPTDDNWNSSSWKQKNTFCYELITPPISKTVLYKQMQIDLLNFFGYRAELAMRKVKCLILKSYGKEMNYNELKKPENNFEHAADRNFIHNQSLSDLVQYLNSRLPIPVIDESNYTSPIHIDFNGDILNIEFLKKELNQYGFDIIEEKRELEMFVLSDKK